MGLPLPFPYNILFFVAFAVVLVVVGIYAMTIPPTPFASQPWVARIDKSRVAGKGALLLCVQETRESEYRALPSLQQMRFGI